MRKDATGEATGDRRDRIEKRLNEKLAENAINKENEAAAATADQTKKVTNAMKNMRMVAQKLREAAPELEAKKKALEDAANEQQQFEQATA